jgi:hypothetical protein
MMIGIGTAPSLLGANQDATLRHLTEPRMSTHYFTPFTGDGTAGKQQAVVVPLSRKALAPMARDRIRRLRKHLVRSLRTLRTMKDPKGSASPLRPEPEGLAGRVARTACSLCRGFCCKGGEEHAYLDERTMARVRLARPELDARAVIRLYTDRVPAESYESSCIFHGAQGCTLDRSLRSDLCNLYFCTTLGNFVRSENAPTSAIVIAVEGEETRISPVLTAEG